MHNRISTGIVFILFMIVGSLNAHAQSAPVNTKKQKTTEQKIVLTIEGMSCQKGCVDGIDHTLRGTNGIIKSKTQFEKSTSVITFNPHIISKQEIIAIIQDKGYKAKEKS